MRVTSLVTLTLIAFCLSASNLHNVLVEGVVGTCAARSEFQCDTGAQCVSIAYVCDGDDDCADASDERNCRTELFRDDFLIVADAIRRNLFQVSLVDHEMVPILPSKPQRPIAVAYDDVNHLVYWTDVGRRTISSYPLFANNSTITTVYLDRDASAVLDGLALDIARAKIYYTDAGDVGKIGEVSLNGTHHRILVTEQKSKPRSIVLGVSSRLMYWSDWGETPSIKRADMDTGRQITTLVSGRLHWPNALAIDFQEGAMFWGDSRLGRLETSRLDGSSRRVIYDHVGDRYYNIAVSPRYLYVTDWTERAVRMFDRRTSHMSDQLPALFGQLCGIAYYKNPAAALTPVSTPSSTRTRGSTTKTSTTTTTTTPTTTTTTTTTSTTTTSGRTTTLLPSSRKSSSSSSSTSSSTASSASISDSSLTSDEPLRHSSDDDERSVTFISERTLVTITALVLVALVVIVTVIVSAAVISARRKRRESPGVVLTGPQPGSVAAAASLPDVQCSSALKTVAPGNEQARVFNTYDVIADLPPVAMATGPADATGDDYLRPCLNDENTGGYWPDDHYERVKFLDDDDSYYYYYKN